MVLLQFLSCPMVCGWYVVVLRCFTPKNEHILSKNLLTNYGPLSVSRKAGIPYDRTQWSKKIHTTCGAVVFYDRIAQVSFVYRSFMTTMNCFPPLVFGSRPKMSIAIIFRGRPAGRRFRCHFLLRQARFKAHSRQSLTDV